MRMVQFQRGQRPNRACGTSLQARTPRMPSRPLANCRGHQMILAGARRSVVCAVPEQRQTGALPPPNVGGMQVQVPPDALVIRFRPTDPAKVLEWAAKEHRRSGHYRLSVFAAAPGPGGAGAAVQARLLKASELAGIDPAGNAKYFVCTHARQLLDRGFTFWKDDDDPDEPAEHYSVDLGETPTLGVVRRFLEPFGPALRGRP